MKAVQNLYVESRACVRVGNDVSEWFPDNVGLRQGCVMSQWLFNVYVYGVVREVNVRVLGNELELLSANGGRFELLFADVICSCYLQMIQHLWLTQRESCCCCYASTCLAEQVGSHVEKITVSRGTPQV